MVDNMAPPFESWRSWSSRSGISPDFEIKECEGISCLEIRSTERFADFGKWIGAVLEIKGGRSYQFSVEYKGDNIRCHDVCVGCIISWFSGELSPEHEAFLDPGNNATDRVWLMCAQILNDGWIRLSRTLKAPPDSCAAGMELFLRWSPHGKVLWRNPEVIEAAHAVKRKVRLATTHIKPYGGQSDTEANLERTMKVIDKAGKSEPDFICLSECYLDRGVELPLAETAQPIPGPFTEKLAQKAVQYRTHIVTSLHERADDLVYNTAVLISPEGKILGTYRKVNLPLIEGEEGVTPGSEYPVFDTEYGRVGMMICWDNAFPEVPRIMALQGAEMIFMPLAGGSVLFTRAYAANNAVVVVASCTTGKTPSTIISATGEVLADTLGDLDAVITEVDLDEKHMSHWLAVGPCNGEPYSQYFKDRRPDTYGILTGDLFKGERADRKTY